MQGALNVCICLHASETSAMLTPPEPERGKPFFVAAHRDGLAPRCDKSVKASGRVKARKLVRSLGTPAWFLSEHRRCYFLCYNHKIEASMGPPTLSKQFNNVNMQTRCQLDPHECLASLQASRREGQRDAERMRAADSGQTAMEYGFQMCGQLHMVGMLRLRPGQLPVLIFANV